jgi:hypothetical protein
VSHPEQSEGPRTGMIDSHWRMTTQASIRFAQDDKRFNVLTLQRFNKLSILRPRLPVVARPDRPLRTHEALPR